MKYEKTPRNLTGQIVEDLQMKIDPTTVRCFIKPIIYGSAWDQTAGPIKGALKAMTDEL